ncbi:MAG: cytidylate kinase [Ilumatobacteraceae bacterium]|nr:cytidylate kinase [Ilumatobacteraceae bacterium]
MTNVPANEPVRVVTVSATYGAGGSVVAPRLAERLGLAFADRVISPATASDLESLSEEEKAQAPPSRWLSALSRVAAMVPSAPVPIDADLDAIADLRRTSERHITEALGLGPTLFLGRAAAVVLADRPGAFHIRLDGPVARRIARAAASEHQTEAEAKHRCETTDRARDHFVRRLYGVDPADPGLYHLVLDTTAFPTADVVDLLATAAATFWSSR